MDADDIKIWSINRDHNIAANHAQETCKVVLSCAEKWGLIISMEKIESTVFTKKHLLKEY